MKKIVSIIFFIWLLTMGVFSITPYLSREFIAFRSMLLVLGVILMLLIIASKKKIENLKLVIILLIWIGIQVLYHVIGYSTSSLGTNFGLINFYVLIFSSIFMDVCIKENVKKYLVILSIIIIIINVISNIVLLEKNVNANTLIMVYDNQYLKTNIGSTSFIAMVYMFSLIMLSLFLDKTKYSYLYLIGYILSSFLLIVLYTRATSSLLLLVFSLILVFEKITINIDNKSKFFIKLVFILLLIFFSFNIVAFIANYFQLDRLLNRLDWISNLLKNNLEIKLMGNNSLASRIYLISITLKTFTSSFKTFLFGVGDKLVTTKSIYSMITTTGVGFHSDLIDVLGTNGIIGGVLMYSILYMIYSCIIKKKYCNSTKLLKKEILIIYIAFITYSLFNRNLGGELGYIVLVILPNLYTLSEKKYNNKKE